MLVEHEIQSATKQVMEVYPIIALSVTILGTLFTCLGFSCLFVAIYLNLTDKKATRSVLVGMFEIIIGSLLFGLLISPATPSPNEITLKFIKKVLFSEGVIFLGISILYILVTTLFGLNIIGKEIQEKQERKRTPNLEDSIQIFLGSLGLSILFFLFSSVPK